MDGHRKLKFGEVSLQICQFYFSFFFEKEIQAKNFRPERPFELVRLPSQKNVEIQQTMSQQ